MANHQAIVAKVSEVIEIPGANTIQEIVVLGEHLVASKEVKVGDWGVFFPVDVQLSEEYCHLNNLYRRSDKNKDNSKKGFFDDNRRVRAQPFMKIKSTGYFASLDSLSYTGNSAWELGQTFSEIHGVKICEKYISQAAKEKISRQGNVKKKVTLFPTFDKHVDSSQFKHNVHRLK